MDKSVIQQFEKQVDELIQLSRQLRDENKLLESQKSALIAERNQLTEKTDIARDRIEKMMDKLKQLNREV